MGTISPHVDAETPDDAVDIAAHLEKLIPPLELVRMDPDAPEYDATVDQFKFDSLGHLKTLQAFVRSQSADAAPMDTQWEEMTWFTLLRLDGPSEFQSVQGRLLVQDCLANLAQPNDLFHSLLLHKIKPVFASAPHPDVNHETGRKLSVPAGGARARLDRFNEQSWKQASEYGIVNALRGCLQRMTEEQVTQEMALVLPPLLTIMDDWDTQYRLQGLECLEVLLDKVAPVTMKRMGIDQLFLKSIQHSISLHPTPPSPPMLESALSSLFRLLDLIMDPATDEYANQVSLAVEQGVIDGWQYAPSGMPGLEVMIEIGVGVEMLCEKVGVGMIRWLNDLIPGLLSSSYSPPSPLSIGLQLTNLHALHVLLTTIQSTCRAERWQGQIIDALGRNWVGIDEKRKMLELSGSDAMEQDQFQVTQDEMETVQELLRTVLGDLVETSPELRKNELLHLLELSPEAFGGFVKGFVDSSPSATTTTSTAPPPLPVRPGGTTSPPPPPLPARNPLSQGSPMQEVHQDEPSARRFVAPLSASGTARPVQPPPQRQVEPVEQATPPPVDSSRVGQARQQANDIYKQYKPLVRQRQDEAKQAASTFSEFAGRLIKGDHQQGRDQSQSGYGMGGSGTGSNPGGTADGGAHREDLERMGQQALRGLNRVGKQVAGGIDRFQQQMQAGK